MQEVPDINNGNEINFPLQKRLPLEDLMYKIHQNMRNKMFDHWKFQINFYRSRFAFNISTRC